MYLVRRHLNMSPEEWGSLPWWQAQMYWEGLEAEFMQRAGDEAQEAPEATDELTELSGMGFDVHKVAV